MSICLSALQLRVSGDPGAGIYRLIYIYIYFIRIVYSWVFMAFFSFYSWAFGVIFLLRFFLISGWMTTFFYIRRILYLNEAVHLMSVDSCRFFALVLLMPLSIPPTHGLPLHASYTFTSLPCTTLISYAQQRHSCLKQVSTYISIPSLLGFVTKNFRFDSFSFHVSRWHVHT